MRVAERGHDLDLPADVKQVLIVLDLLLSDRLYGHLGKQKPELRLPGIFALNLAQFSNQDRGQKEEDTNDQQTCC